MDALLQLMLPEMVSVEGLNENRVTFFWGGEEHLQEPITYKWGMFVELVPSQLTSYILDLLPVELNVKNWKIFDIRGECLDMLCDEVEGYPVDWINSRLDDLLELLLHKSGKWILLFEPHYDTIDNIYQHTVEECITKLKESLAKSPYQEGFISIRQGSSDNS
jgi:hypothetical protein